MCVCLPAFWRWPETGSSSSKEFLEFYFFNVSFGSHLFWVEFNETWEMSNSRLLLDFRLFLDCMCIETFNSGQTLPLWCHTGRCMPSIGTHEHYFCLLETVTNKARAVTGSLSWQVEAPPPVQKPKRLTSLSWMWMQTLNHQPRYREPRSLPVTAQLTSSIPGRLHGQQWCGSDSRQKEVTPDVLLSRENRLLTLSGGMQFGDFVFTVLLQLWFSVLWDRAAYTLMEQTPEMKTGVTSLCWPINWQPLWCVGTKFLRSAWHQGALVYKSSNSKKIHFSFQSWWRSVKIRGVMVH